MQKTGEKHVQLLICQDYKLGINLNDANFVIRERKDLQQ